MHTKAWPNLSRVSILTIFNIFRQGLSELLLAVTALKVQIEILRFPLLKK